MQLNNIQLKDILIPYKKKWGIPYVVSEHSATYVPGPPDTFENRSSYFRSNVRSIFRKATGVTSVSNHDGKIIKNLLLIL